MIRKIALVVTVAVLLLSSGCAQEGILDSIRKRAEQGSAEAQFRLGGMYHYGEGVPQDYTEAFKWYRKAAERGHVDSQLMLGNRYYNGKGVPQDYTEALKWYQKAAEQGDALAQTNLGFMYEQGEGVSQNYVRAYMWTSLAASKLSDTPLQEYRDQALKGRDLIEEKMTPEQIAEAKKLSREWKPK